MLRESATRFDALLHDDRVVDAEVPYAVASVGSNW